ncbi:MetQ/NlpA family ABC transporter substrate-binding protein [Streptococcaceae bacterium ESL0687]|nr:MetQ/NlpA family ABC transporter substrate-binding protein [Streptococcaceae bacterium ESL0687]
MKKGKLLGTLLAGLALFSLTACGNQKDSSSTGKKSYTIGVVSDVEDKIWKSVAKSLKDQDIELKVKQFSDYNTPNDALADGSLDLNAFQSVGFLNNYNKEKNQDLVSIGYTYVSPMGLYSSKLKDYKDIKSGDTIAIPNDVTNGGRALQLLDAINVIKLKDNAPTSPSKNDIESYLKQVDIKEIDASQTPAALPDVAAAVINTNYAVDSGLKPKEDAIYLDTDNLSKVGEIYKNLVAVKKKDETNPDFKKIVAAYQTDKIAGLIKDESGGNDLPAWE